MQVKNKTFLTDEESILLAQKKILGFYNEHKNSGEYELIKTLSSKYNDEIYARNILDIYFQIKDFKLKD